MRIVLAFLVAAALPACVATSHEDDHDPADPADPADPSDPSDPSDPPPPPPVAVASGAYTVRTNVDLTVEALLPQTAADVVVTLRSFSTSPGDTMLDLAQEAGVPAVQQIRDDLPDYVEDKLVGWIDAEIAKVTLNGTPVTQIAGNTAALAETALTQFALDSTLTITNGTATHELTTLDLTPAGIEKTFSLADLPADMRSQTATCTSSDGSLAIGDHTYGLPYGEYIWVAINEQLVAQYGYDLRGAFGAAVNCPALAHTIANKCVWGYCVGHETELNQICEKGLDEATQRVHDKLAENNFEALHFVSGTATLVDSNNDGPAESLADGVWDAEIDAGQGLRHVPATFSGSR
jgi:hypothetical protein